MLEKIKQAVLYIVAPILAVLGYIFYQQRQIGKLTGEKAQADAEKTIATTLGKKEKIDEDAKKSDDLFNAAVSEFKSKYGSGEEPPPAA